MDTFDEDTLPCIPIGEARLGPPCEGRRPLIDEMAILSGEITVRDTREPGEETREKVIVIQHVGRMRSS